MKDIHDYVDDDGDGDDYVVDDDDDLGHGPGVGTSCWISLQ